MPAPLVKAMADAMAHRGPDDDGYYISGPVALGFRRLAIIDLSGGHQPLSNEDGTVWIAFNGEIYNYQELRAELIGKGHVFKTKSDTEVIVHLYEEFGEACPEKLRGMFAFAIWDERKESLFLARDRVGIKPLYYRMNGRSIVFASEIKAILADPEVEAKVDPAIVDRFLTFYYVPGEETLFEGIRKLAPGTSMTVRGGKARTRTYWDLEFAAREIGEREAADELVALLEESVRLHMISDVPVGFLLSGGVDSTAMLGFAAGKTDKPISSYTIGFADSDVVDERPYARLAAERYGSEHHEMTISAKDFADFLPQYVWHMEEPVCEPPAVALYYVSKMAKDFVKVLISGEGGDEAFAGYANYRNIGWIERLKRAGRPVAALCGGAMAAANSITRSKKLERHLPLFGMRLEEYYYSRTSSPDKFFNRRFAEVYSPEFASGVDKKMSASVMASFMARGGEGRDPLSKMLYADTKTWLPDDLLIKADKMTMANSIELRVPLLDHKVLEFAAALPANLKVRGTSTKYIAKKALNERVPREILERKKTGFPVPYERWLRKDLREWVRGILLDGQSLRRGYFRKDGLEELLAREERGGEYSKEIFSLAVLELWHREFLGTAKARRPEDLEAAPYAVA